MKSLLVKIVATPVLGILAVLYLNYHHMNIFGGTYNVSDNLFAIGIAYVIMGCLIGFNMGSVSKGFMYQYIVSTDRKLADKSEESKSTNIGVGTGMVMLISGIVFIVFAICV